MVHVVLHLRDDAAEIGHEAAEHAGLREAAQAAFGILRRGQHLQEQAVGLGVGAQVAIDQAEILGDQPQAGRMDVEAVALGHFEQAEHVERALGERLPRGQGEPTAVDAEALDLLAEDAEIGQPEDRLAVLRLEGGAEDAGEVTDVLGGQEVVLHQPLDAAGAGVIGVAQALRQLGLEIEAQALLRPAREIVEADAHRPQEGLGLVEGGGLGGGEHAALDQRRDVIGFVEILGDPEEGVEIAQAALALLDVGLEDIARDAHAAVALVALGQLGLDERAAGAGDDLLGVAPAELLIELLVAAEVAGLQEVGADGHVRLGLTDAVIDRAGGVADLQAEVPEVIEDVLHHLLAMGVSL